jgi:hypothetical protein
VRDFRLPGSYRRLLGRPIDLEWYAHIDLVAHVGAYEMALC